jgi:hypothetical protein
VRRVVGHIHEEGTVLVGIDRLRRFFGQVVRHVFRRSKALRAAIVHDGVGEVRPEELVDRVEVLAGFDDVGIARRQEEGGAAEEAEILVEPSRFRTGRRGLAQMPLAEHQRAIALVLEHLGQGCFRRRHGHLGHLGNVLLAIRMIDGLVRVRRRHVAEQLGELDGNRCELEAEARGEAARHHGGARRRTGRVARIGLREVGAILRDGVDVRCQDGAVVNACPRKGDVVVAEVVGNDQDDVRRAVRHRCLRRRGTLLPDDFLVRSDRIEDRLADAGDEIPVLLECDVAGDACHKHRACGSNGDFSQVHGMARVLKVL